MFNLRPFDSKPAKFNNWLGVHPAFLIALFTTPGVLVTVLTREPQFLILVLFGLMFSLAFYAQGEDMYVGTRFARKNNLEKFFMKHGDDYDFIYHEYRSMIHSTFLKAERTVWSMPVSGTEFATVFTDDGGCLCWMPLGRTFPHLVIDSVQDNPLFGHQWSKKALPVETIRLEGNFNHEFHVFQEPDEQIMTLQILSPDRMAVLLDEFKAANVEIQDKYLRVYVADVQKSSAVFGEFLKVLAEFERSFKIDRINKIL